MIGGMVAMEAGAAAGAGAAMEAGVGAEVTTGVGAGVGVTITEDSTHFTNITDIIVVFKKFSYDCV